MNFSCVADFIAAVSDTSFNPEAYRAAGIDVFNLAGPGRESHLPPLQHLVAQLRDNRVPASVSAIPLTDYSIKLRQ